MRVYAETHTHRLPCQHTVKVRRGEAGFREKSEKEALVHDITDMKATKYEPTHGHTTHRFVISFNTRDVKPQVTNDSVPLTAPKPQVRTH